MWVFSCSFFLFSPFFLFFCSSLLFSCFFCLLIWRPLWGQCDAVRVQSWPAYLVVDTDTELIPLCACGVTDVKWRPCINCRGFLQLLHRACVTLPFCLWPCLQLMTGTCDPYLPPPHPTAHSTPFFGLVLSVLWWLFLTFIVACLLPQSHLFMTSPISLLFF